MFFRLFFLRFFGVFGTFGVFRYTYHLKITSRGVFDRFWPDFRRFLADQKSVHSDTFLIGLSDQKSSFSGVTMFENCFGLILRPIFTPKTKKLRTFFFQKLFPNQKSVAIKDT